MPENNITEAVTNAAGTNAATNLHKLHTDKWQPEYIYNYLLNHSDKIARGMIILLVGFLVARAACKAVSRALERQRLEPPVRMLIVRLVRLLIFLIALTMALDTWGFQVTALLAGLGVAGVGIGFAMQGLLSNLMAGLTIIFTKPFRVGEYIEILTVRGVVSHIDLMSTTLVHSDMSRVMIPNHKIIGEVLHNFGMMRQLDVSVGVGYSTDLGKAQRVALEILNQNPRVLKDPPPMVAVAGLRDSSITLAVKPWVKAADYGGAQTELYQAIVERFREHQIEIPFAQQEVRILNLPVQTAL